MSLKVYVVTGNYSDYDDYGHWLVKGFTNKDEADSLCQKMNTRSCELADQYLKDWSKVRKINDTLKYHDEYLRFDKKWTELKNEFDPYLGSFAHTWYDVEELEVNG